MKKNKNKILVISLILVIIIAAIFLKNNPRKLTIVAGGNALVSNSVLADSYLINENNYDFSNMLTYLKEYINKYDIKFYSQESPINGSEYKYSGRICYNTPYNFAIDMIQAGFNMVNLATDHTIEGEIALNEQTNSFYCQYQENAISNSKTFWNNFETVYTSGSYLTEEERNQIIIKEKNGISYTLLSYTTTINDENNYKNNPSYVNLYNEEQVKKDIEKVRNKVDLVLVSIHWQDSNDNIPTNYQKETVKYLSQLGVDIVIGHGPQVIQPIEKINDTLVIYSLGNLILNYQYEENFDKDIGQLVGIEIIKKNNKIKINKVTSELIYNYYDINIQNIKIVPFSQMNQDYNENYLTLYNKYSQIIKRYDENINVNSPSLKPYVQKANTFKNRTDKTFTLIDKTTTNCKDEDHLISAIETVLSGYNIKLKESQINNCQVDTCKIFDENFVNCEQMEKLTKTEIINYINTHKQIISKITTNDHQCYKENQYITILDYDEKKGLYIYNANNKKECNGWQNIELIEQYNTKNYIAS